MLLSLSLIILLGLMLSGLLHRLHLPGLLGMLIAGMILGPYGLDMIHPSILVISKELRQIALVIILMRAGLSLDLYDLKSVGKSALWMTFVPASFEILAVLILGPWLLGLSILDSALLGAVLAAVSPAVVVPRMLKLMDEGYGKKQPIPQMIMAGASVDDVYVIVLFTSFLALSLGKGISIAAFLDIPLSLMTGILMGILTGLISISLFKKFHMRDTVKVLILLSLAFLFISFENSYGRNFPFSAYIAVISMGAMILQKYALLAQRIALKFNKAWVAAELLLFALVGSAVDLSSINHLALNVILLLVLALLVRMVGVWVALLKSKLSFKEKLFCALAYIPKATVQAAIGAIPLTAGLSSGPIILSAAVLAILITAPLGAFMIDHSYKKLLTHIKEA